VQRFTKADLDALTVRDDVVLSLTDDIRARDGGPQSELPGLPAECPAEGAAIAVWHMFSSPDRRGGNVPKWLHNQGINHFRGWIYRAGANDPDGMFEGELAMAWIFLVDDGTYRLQPCGGAGLFDPGPTADLQAFVTAVAEFSFVLLMDGVDRMVRGFQEQAGTRNASRRRNADPTL
jgi:hypothetical protein